MTMPADFSTWSHEALAQFAKEANDDRNRLRVANINLANDEVKALQVLLKLMDKYEYICNIYCMKPETHVEYRQAKELLGASKEA